MPPIRGCTLRCHHADEDSRNHWPRKPWIRQKQQPKEVPPPTVPSHHHYYQDTTDISVPGVAKPGQRTLSGSIGVRGLDQGSAPFGADSGR
mmetsp:Transcript_20493/g.42815  ORF Transcript_20493/g.42815 Transcript_20493/m.42815 type:complete len:91 (-) Transcript_20493:151-423(-)